MKRGLLFAIIVSLVFLISFSSAIELLIDNSDSTYSDQGTWVTALSSCGYNGNYRYETSSDLNETARWDITAPINGDYKVYVHYCAHSVRPNSTQYVIVSSSGTFYAEVDQTKDASGNSVPDFTASGWKYIGTFNFDNSSAQYIELNTTSPGDTTADAVKLSTGPLINNKNISSSCILQNDSIKLYANISSTMCIGNVIFSVYNGFWTNYTGITSLTPSPGNYSATINANPLGIINWTVFAEDCYGNIIQDGTESFYVNSHTSLSVTPANPDGINGWYLTEPQFILSNSDASSIFYRWDSSQLINYTFSFKLEGAPNNASQTGGILELNYFADICSEQNNRFTFKVDLTNPLIKSLVPENNSIVYNEQRPTIQAYLDEIYGENSGINLSSLIMLIDGINVPTTIFPEGIDALVRHNPLSNLSVGKHNVTVSVSDKAGRNSILTWFFSINLSLLDFNMTVYSPKNNSATMPYGTTRIPFNISLTKAIDTLEFINYNNHAPKWRLLCRNCDNFGFIKTEFQNLNDGQNDITIKARDIFGNTQEKNISLNIDSRLPKIIDIRPRANSIINGSLFSIKYTENNLKDIKLVFNGTANILNCSAGNKQECLNSLNLSQYNGNYFDYYFLISDFVTSVNSSKKRVFVDTSIPGITVYSPLSSLYPEKVKFNLTISEKAKLEYKDISALNPKWRTLCVNCNEYGNLKGKTISFKDGNHTIIIRATDHAGNLKSTQTSFAVS